MNCSRGKRIRFIILVFYYRILVAARPAGATPGPPARPKATGPDSFQSKSARSLPVHVLFNKTAARQQSLFSVFTRAEAISPARLSVLVIEGRKNDANEYYRSDDGICSDGRDYLRRLRGRLGKSRWASATTKG